MPISDYVMPEGVPPMLRDAYMAKMLELGTVEGATPGNRSNLAAIKSSIADWENQNISPAGWDQPASEDERVDLNDYSDIDWESQAPINPDDPAPATRREIRADDKPSEHFISSMAGNFDPDVNYETRPVAPEGQMVSKTHTSAPRARISSSQAPIAVTPQPPAALQQQQATRMAQATQMREAYNRKREDYFNPFGPLSEYSDLQKQRTG